MNQGDFVSFQNYQWVVHWRTVATVLNGKLQLATVRS